MSLITFTPKIRKIAIVIFILTAVSTVAIAIKGSSAQSPTPYWLFTIVASILTSSLSIYLAILMGKPLEKHLEEILQRQELGAAVLALWEVENVKETGFIALHGGAEWSWRDDIKSRWSPSTAYSIFKLEKFLTAVYTGRAFFEFLPLKRYQDTSLMRSRHIVLLGGIISTPEVNNLYGQIALPFGQLIDDKDDTKRYITVKANDGRYPSTISDNKVITDYGTITLIREEKSGRRMYWFNGNFGFATFGAILLMTRNDHAKLLPFPKRGHYVQAIVEVSNIINEEMDENHQSLRLILPVEEGVLPDNFSINSIITNKIVMT
jgi:hypothetical protein